MIRRADGADAETLARIHADAFAPSWTAQAFKDLLGSPSAFALIDDTQSGLILVRVAADEGEILTLGVVERARRAGLGRALVRGAREEAERLNVRALFLEVAADNAAALTLYRAEGFEPVGRRPSYYPRPGGAGMDATLLRLGLSGAA